MKIATTVGALLCAAHRGRDERVHGHTWTVWARFAQEDADRCKDALELQERLRKIIAIYDHDFLPDALRAGEDIARWVAASLDGVDYVRVERTAEMIVAEWWA